MKTTAETRLPVAAWLVLLLAALVFLLHAVAYRGYLLDDAYISLRYAQHLVDGHGLVWNPGEPVEGYTNFLWVLLGAAFLKSGVEAMTAWKTVSALATLALLAILARLQRLGGHRRVLPAAVWLLASEGFAYYATTGMETALFAALTVTAIYLGLREAGDGRRRGSLAVFLLLALTRPEGVFLFALGQGLFALVEHTRRGVLGLRRRAADLLGFALVYGAYTAWRLVTYGEPLPNTYHARVTGGGEQLAAGLAYLAEWGSANPVFALALLAPAVVLLRRARRTWRAVPELAAVWSIAVAWTVYVVAVGGDSMPYHRFFLPILPLWAVLLSWTLSAAGRAWPRLAGGGRLLGIAALLLVVQLLAGRASEEPVRAFVAHRTTAVGLEAGRHFAATRDGDELIAVNTAGALPYASGLPALDMLGLTEPQIAHHGVYVASPRWVGHRRGWGRHVLSRWPAVIVWYNSAGSREPHYLGDHQLADAPAFRFFYQLRSARLPPMGAAERPVARLRGAPFGDGVSPNLGARFEVRPPPFERTAAFEAPIVLHYFERRRGQEGLWPLWKAAKGELDGFLDAAVDHWRQAAAKPFDRAARRRVEALCRDAAERVRAGRRDEARALLRRAAAQNGAARSPLVGHYVANLAVAEKNLFLAVEAQLKALRLAPDTELYRHNLRRLLTVPYREFMAGETAPD